MTPPPGARVGSPAPAPLVGAYATAALACWAAAAAALLAAAPDLAAGNLAAPRVLLAVHLVALGFLPLAVTGAALHVLPILLRNDASARRGWAALPLLALGPALAWGIAFDVAALVDVGATAVTAGFALVAYELTALALRAPRGRTLLASRVGVVLSVVHAAAALAVGAALAAHDWRPLWGVPHERAIAVHLHLAAIGWLTLLVLTVGRTLGPMLALAPSAPRRRVPVEELALTAGLWLLVAGLVLDLRALELAGALLAVAAVGAFAALMARVAATHRLDLPEGPLLHLLAGLFLLAQAAALAVALLLGLEASPRRLAAYVVALLLGWATGVTLGHLGKLLSLSLWTWWPPGPRPAQAALYPARLWLAEAALFATGVEAVVVGIVAGAETAVAAGALLLLLAAALAVTAAARSFGLGRPALAPRAFRP